MYMYMHVYAYTCNNVFLVTTICSSRIEALFLLLLLIQHHDPRHRSEVARCSRGEEHPSSRDTQPQVSSHHLVDRLPSQATELRLCLL